MIIRLTTVQISDHWDAIKEMIKQATKDIPGQTKDKDNSILRSLIIGSSVCWILYERIAERQNDIKGMMITRIFEDELVDVKNLFIYTIKGWGMVESDSYKEGFDTLKRYGKENNCNRIIFYSEIPMVFSIAEMLGFNIDIRFGVYNLT